MRNFLSQCILIRLTFNKKKKKIVNFDYENFYPNLKKKHVIHYKLEHFLFFLKFFPTYKQCRFKMKKIYSLLFPNTCPPINHSSFYINFINQRARLPPLKKPPPNRFFFSIYALKFKDLILLKYTCAILTCLCINLSTRFYTVILFSKKVHGPHRWSE